ncbi:AAA family ATPase [Proteus faecis]|uniref:AAA family ATPase n=1 Tax=Proteus faecis TaxID=2050967 RepID=UPI003075D4BF
MYLESLTIENYRKFYNEENKICFVKPEPIIVNNEKKSTIGIAPSTTLIIGKNNTGKTTIVNALRMLRFKEQPIASDFNLYYLNKLFEKYKKEFKKNPSTTFDKLETPYLKFTLNIKISFKDEDLISNLSPFIPISENKDPIKIPIIIKVILSETPIFKENIKKIFKNITNEEKKEKEQFEKFYSLLSKNNGFEKTKNNLYKFLFQDSSGNTIDTFSLNNLINIKEIKANRHLKDGVLSEIFNKIIGFQFTNDHQAYSSLEENIKSMNKNISSNVASKNNNISEILGEIENRNKVNLELSGNITYDAILKGLIKYSFMDNEDYIPEDQFGLGYINLINIIGEIIHFVDSYEEKSQFNCINLLFIEEPEVFMHPQMQELFIKRIDNAVKKALELANKTSEYTKVLQCQIIITTHSSHIVNSKIHSSHTFNNLNYLTIKNKCTKAINLTDDILVSKNEEDAKEKLNFLKKHIKYKVSELFFSDAIIFVEGITEETLLNYFLDNHPVLKNYYISIFNINGAHGKLYLPLVITLGIPCLIVTDIDIKRAKCEKGEKHKKDESCNICKQKEKIDPTFSQITTLKKRITTNETIKEFNQKIRKKKKDDADKLDDIDFFKSDNYYIVFQKDPIEGQYATSLEEAFILTNYNNNIVNNTIKKCKPDIYKSVLIENDEQPRKGLIENSYKLQKKLSDSKSDFSNILLFNLLSIDDDTPILPNYLNDGLIWLATQLHPNDPSSSNEEMYD